MLGSSARPGRCRLGLLGAIAGLLSGCAGAVPGGSPPVTVDGAGPRPALAAGAQCPGGISRIIDTERPIAGETVLALDFSGSFINSDDARSLLRAQVRSLVGQSVERGEALRIVTFTGTASGAGTIVACPSLAPKYNNAAARSRKVESLKLKATAAVDLVLESAIRTRMTRKPGRGTSVVGGFLAIDQSAPLVGPGTPRDAIMFSDGDGLDEEAALDLSNFRSVALYGVGADATDPLGTSAAGKLAQRWTEWLTEHGAKSPIVSTQRMF